MALNKQQKEYDIIIAGGGFSGICAAVTAARLGRRTALINNRSAIGGNAGPEGFICVNGATGTQEFNFFAREPGIVEEILLENMHRNPDGNRWIWDALLIEKIHAEPTLDLYLNTTVTSAEIRNGHIISLTATGSQDETETVFFADMFIDDTGDGTLAALAGCEFRYGREARSEFGEMIAPEEADRWVLPSTMIFYGKDAGHPVSYQAPSFALDIRKTKLLQNRILPENDFHHNFWYYELDGDLDQTADYAKILEDQRAFVYGIWDYIKNSGKFRSENYDLEYVSSMPAKRESRRIIGDYILTGNDIVDQKEFEDPIAYGGWSIDLHALEGIYSDDIQNRHYILNGIFQIPYRSCYAKDADNLFICGRSLSVTHVAHGSTRLIATLGMIGEAVAAAAHICISRKTTNRGLYENHLPELKQALLRLGHTVFGERFDAPDDLARKARITASSCAPCVSGLPESFLPLECDAAVCLPVSGSTLTMQIFVKASENTDLHYTIYLPKNEFGYAPDTATASGFLSVHASGGGQWLEFTEQVPANRYLFICFERNPSVSIGRSGEILPGVLCLLRKSIANPCVYSALTRTVKNSMWRRTPYSFTFSCPGNGIYTPDNITNGYLNPYNGTNMWVSGEDAPGQYVEADFGKTVTVSRMDITFNADSDRRLRNSVHSDIVVIPQLIADFDVAVSTGDDWHIIREVRGNYQRVCSVALGSVKCEKLRVIIRRTNGVRRAAIVSLSVY